MRMWMIDPKKLCRKHLLGEHVETHMLAGTLNREKSIDGFVENGLVEVLSLQKRHDDLAAEMQRRGYNHQSPLPVVKFSYLSNEQRNAKVDVSKSEEDLRLRCDVCEV
jgi:hypothetical protein